MTTTIMNYEIKYFDNINKNLKMFNILYNNKKFLLRHPAKQKIQLSRFEILFQ